MTAALSRRAVLRALGALPVLLAAGRGAAASGDAADAAPSLSAAQRRLGFASAQAEELAAPLTTLAGRLPPDLTGVLWRNGPAEHERFGHRYDHWFDGDGMVQAFTFTGSGVSHRARILETRKRRRETAAGKRVLPAFATLPPEAAPIMSPDDMNAANTSVLAQGGRLMALWEGGSALEFDAETLEAGEFVSWRPDLAGAPFSAHPKVEADGTCWNIGCVTFPRPMLLFYRIDAQGRLAAFNALPIDPLGMVHDFVVTQRHLVLVLSPFVIDPERFAAGPDQLSRRPCLAAGARHPRHRGGEGHTNPRPPLRAAAGLPLPPRQRVGGGGRHHPSRSLPGGGPDVRHPRPAGVVMQGDWSFPLRPAALQPHGAAGPAAPPRSSRWRRP